MGYICPKLVLLLALSYTYTALNMSAGASHAQTKVSRASQKGNHLVTAFWNLENFMDTIDNPGNDNEFTPRGAKKWDTEKFNQKLNHIRSVISAIKPDIMGFAEIEHPELTALLIHGNDAHFRNYRYVHYESPDKRGIDVSLIYNPDKVKEIRSESIRVLLTDSNATRDILYVSLAMVNKTDTLHVFVNHWPSRRGGKTASDPKRMKAAKALANYIRKSHLGGKKTLFMGDFNDEPTDQSLLSGLHIMPPENNKKIPVSDTLYYCLNYNIAGNRGKLNTDSFGTMSYEGKWQMFDLMIINMPKLWPPGHLPGMQSKPGGELVYKEHSFQIFAPFWICDKREKYSGQPYRTYSGNTWIGGYSDHFPVTAIFHYE